MSTWSGRSIEALASRVDEAAPWDQARGSLLSTSSPTVLVEILAYEGGIDAAWKAASTYGCDDRNWLTLARAREATHPLDSIDVYEQEALTQINRRKNEAYRAAVDLMARIRRLAERAGESERFQRVRHRVRAEHKAKRNLKALRDQKGW